MKFKKKSKSVIAVTVIFSVAVCFCFLAIGAYAAPCADNDSAMKWEDSEIDNIKSLTQEEKELVIDTAAGGSSDRSASYEKLIAYKTGNYSQQSIAEFNAALASTPDELGELLAAQADVISTISHDDENYDFFTTSVNFSAQELYCEHMGEEVTFFAGISKRSRPSNVPDADGEIWYEFNCFADLYVAYSIKAPELVTVAERDNMLLKFEEEMQYYLDGLSEAEITDGNIRTMLTDKTDELINSLSTENMKLLSCEIGLLEIFDSGTDSIQ